MNTDLSPDPEERYAYAVATDQRAQTYRAEGQYDLAEQDHHYVLRAAETLNKPRFLAAALFSTGQTLTRAGRLQESLATFEAGFKVLAAESTALGTVLEHLRRVDKGFDPPRIFSRALDLSFKRNATYTLTQWEADPMLEVAILTATGDAYLRMGQYKVALDRYEQAESIAGNQREWQGQIAANRAMTLRALGQRDKAIAEAQRAIELLREGDDLTPARWALGVQAGLLRDKGEYEAAEALFKQVIVLYDQAEDDLGAARMTSNLGLVYILQERWREAERLYKAVLPRIREHNDKENLWHILWGYGRAAFHVGKPQKAEQLLEESVAAVEAQAGELRTDEGTVTFLESRQDLFDSLIEVQVARAVGGKPGKWETALNTVERARGRALEALLGARNRRRPRPVWEPVPAGVAPTHAPPPQNGDDRGFLTNNTQAAMGTPIDDLMQKNISMGVWRESTTDIVVERVEASALPRVVFHVLPTQTVTFYVNLQGDVTGFMTPHGRDEMREVVTAARFTVGKTGFRGIRGATLEEESPPPEIVNPLLTLYEWLMAPIADKLTGTVVIEPHGVLWQLPFAAVGATPDTPLGKTCAFILTPAGRVLEDIRTSKDYGSVSDLPVLLVGNPTYSIVSGFEFDPLPGAEQEVVELETLLSARHPTVYRQATATRHAVQAAMGTHGVLHLATHGYADTGNPLDSFVVLASDGQSEDSPLLKARDILNMNLPADLVVLSACQTGLGLVSGDGVIGLSRALLVAGARTVLVSLWNVDDHATADFMRLFYQHYLEHDNKATALQHAISEFLKNPETDDPRLWAAFYLVGAER